MSHINTPAQNLKEAEKGLRSPEAEIPLRRRTPFWACPPHQGGDTSSCRSAASHSNLAPDRQPHSHQAPSAAFCPLLTQSCLPCPGLGQKGLGQRRTPARRLAPASPSRPSGQPGARPGSAVEHGLLHPLLSPHTFLSPQPHSLYV